MGENERDFLEDQALNPADDVATPAANGTADKPVEGEPAAATPPAGAPAAVEAPAASNPPESHVPLAALMAERDKRQEAARKAEAAERELAELRRQREQAAPATSFWDNPEQSLQNAVQLANAQAQDRLFAALEEQAREVHPDFDEVFKEVEEQAKQNPAIAAQVMQSANPALAAYKLGKKLRETKQVLEDPAAYRERLKAEIRAELDKEAADKAAAAAKVADSIPPDLTDTRSAKGNEPPPPESVFDEIFKP